VLSGSTAAATTPASSVLGQSSGQLLAALHHRRLGAGVRPVVMLHVAAASRCRRRHLALLRPAMRDTRRPSASNSKMRAGSAARPAGVGAADVDRAGAFAVGRAAPLLQPGAGAAELAQPPSKRAFSAAGLALGAGAT
jgi:hypothetical protein